MESQVTIRSKLFLQVLWTIKLSWDVSVPHETDEVYINRQRLGKD